MDNFVFIVEELRKQIEAERDRLAEGVFETLLESGQMRFMVIADHLDTPRLPKNETYPEGEKRAARLNGRQFELSLFEHVPEDDLNEMLCEAEGPHQQGQPSQDDEQAADGSDRTESSQGRYADKFSGCQ